MGGAWRASICAVWRAGRPSSPVSGSRLGEVCRRGRGGGLPGAQAGGSHGGAGGQMGTGDGGGGGGAGQGGDGLTRGHTARQTLRGDSDAQTLGWKRAGAQEGPQGGLRRGGGEGCALAAAATLHSFRSLRPFFRGSMWRTVWSSDPFPREEPMSRSSFGLGRLRLLAHDGPRSMVCVGGSTTLVSEQASTWRQCCQVRPFRNFKKSRPRGLYYFFKKVKKYTDVGTYR